MSQTISEILSNFSDRLKRIRTSLFKTQDEMGVLLGISGNYVYMVEKGIKPPGNKLIEKLDLLEAELDRKSNQKSSQVETRLDNGGETATAPPLSASRNLDAKRLQCLDHLRQWLDRVGTDPDQVSWALVELRRRFPLENKSAGGGTWDKSFPKTTDDPGVIQVRLELKGGKVAASGVFIAGSIRTPEDQAKATSILKQLGAAFKYDPDCAAAINAAISTAAAEPAPAIQSGKGFAVSSDAPSILAKVRAATEDACPHRRPKS